MLLSQTQDRETFTWTFLEQKHEMSEEKQEKGGYRMFITEMNVHFSLISTWIVWDWEHSGIKPDCNTEKDKNIHKRLSRSWENLQKKKKTFLQSSAFHSDLHLPIWSQNQTSLSKCLPTQDYSPGIYAWLDMTG